MSFKYLIRLHWTWWNLLLHQQLLCDVRCSYDLLLLWHAVHGWVYASQTHGHLLRVWSYQLSHGLLRTWTETIACLKTSTTCELFQHNGKKLNERKKHNLYLCAQMNTNAREIKSFFFLFGLWSINMRAITSENRFSTCIPCLWKHLQRAYQY